LARTTYNTALIVGLRLDYVTRGPAKERNKNDRNFHASNWLFAQTTHIDLDP